ncbi:MAG TPA: ATP-binding protein [Pedobacter sp.]|uniref:ATP-binding protein n=1 Tax=Pedobacter sp. TaxID=1411316 RepID=UPI002C44D0B5|nr:ATP-binding protein [Pedobacter sp.]HMI02122.1 ATP-binding protein [Pedobacter sp.]
MKINIRQKLSLFAFIILAGNGSIGYSIYNSNQDLIDSHKAVQHSTKVISQLHKINFLSKDIEAAAMHVVVTHDSVSAKTLYAAEKTITAYIGQLKQLTKHNALQQLRLDSLKFYVNKRLDFSIGLIGLTGKQGLENATVQIAAKKYQQLSGHIQQITEAIQQEESVLLEKREQTNRDDMIMFNRLSVVLFFLINVFTILLFIASYIYLLQNKAKEKQAIKLAIANKELIFQNQEKEKRAEELTKTNSELDRFVYCVSHDLRSPLTSVLGLVTLIDEESNEPHIIKYAGMIRHSIKRLDRFIGNILNYSRNNRTDIVAEQIPLQETVDEIVAALRNMKEARGINFEVKIDQQHDFYTDMHRFNTIVENLIANAIKYHKLDNSDRNITITGKSDRNNLHLRITDNGIGIVPKYHDKIFEMFFRISGKIAGSGIGLYIVKEIINRLEGSIEVYSEEGKGTSFVIILKNLMP